MIARSRDRDGTGGAQERCSGVVSGLKSSAVTVSDSDSDTTSVTAADSDSDSYMCLLHRTGAHWIPRMGGLYPPQAKV